MKKSQGNSWKTLAVIAYAGIAVTVFAGEPPTKAAKARISDDPAFIASHVKLTDGTTQPTTRGTAWVTYDDGTREGWGANWAANNGAAGNKFTSTWGTFFCDMVSGFGIWTGSGSGFYFSAWTDTTNGGADLTGNSYASLGGLASSASGWVSVDGSTSSFGFIGNSAYTFNNTAWVGAYVYSGNDIGIDTGGTGGHGFYVNTYTGTSYFEMAWNAMVRARFNGAAVPVELAGFTVE